MSPLTTAERSDWSTKLAKSLVQHGFQTEAELRPLLHEAIASDETLAHLLIQRGAVAPNVVVGVLSQLSSIPAVDLANFTPASEAVAALPSAIGDEFSVVPVQFDGRTLTLAFGEPPDPHDLDVLSSSVGYRVAPMLADPVLIQELLGRSSSSIEPPAEHAAAEDLLASGLPAAPEGAPPLHVDDLLRYAVSVGASDLHLTAAMPATIRLHGAIRPIEGCPILDNESIRNMIFGILPGSQRERFEEEHELDTSHSIAGVGRFRLNVALQRGTVSAALRPIPHEMPTFDSLGLPDSIRAFTELRRGLVLVTGPTGSGKSTTLASLIDTINRTKPLHIVTVEDPIEFLHDHKRSIITQREVGEDTKSFSEALRRVLRQDPDVILVGELRDLETISMALTAAETGHLVFGTLHTQDAPQTIDRIIDVFPTNQQEQIRVMLASTLEGVVTQQLVVNTAGTGRVACAEVMVCTSAIRNLIRQAKTHQIYSIMQVGASFGMQTMDQGLARLVKEGRITESIAYDRSANEDDLRNHLNS